MMMHGLANPKFKKKKKCLKYSEGDLDLDDDYRSRGQLSGRNPKSHKISRTGDQRRSNDRKIHGSSTAQEPGDEKGSSMKMGGRL
jgi:hypothetical protein